MRVEYVVVPYQTSVGKKPFDEWLETLRHRDRVAAEGIDSRLARLRDSGNFGDTRSVGHGVRELRIHLGSGYRIIKKTHEYAADFRRKI